MDSVNNADIRDYDSLLRIENCLRDEMEMAQRYCETANLEFWRISADVFSPAHSQKVARAAEIQNVARISLLRALRRLNGFLVSGTVPDNLRTVSGRARAQAA